MFASSAALLLSSSRWQQQCCYGTLGQTWSRVSWDLLERSMVSGSGLQALHHAPASNQLVLKGGCQLLLIAGSFMIILVCFVDCCGTPWGTWTGKTFGLFTQFFLHLQCFMFLPVHPKKGWCFGLCKQLQCLRLGPHNPWTVTDGWESVGLSANKIKHTDCVECERKKDSSSLSCEDALLFENNSRFIIRS